jgi:hypothetical protein
MRGRDRCIAFAIGWRPIAVYKSNEQRNPLLSLTGPTICGPLGNMG